MDAKIYLKNIEKESVDITKRVEEIRNVELPKLLFKERPEQWNVLECLQHLNLYGQFYLPQFEDKIRTNSAKANADFKSGILGGYFCRTILPSEKLKKIKTFKDKNPINQNLTIAVFDEFLVLQSRLMLVLEAAKLVDLNKIKIKTTLSSLIKINLGDAVQFYVNHNIRHMQQIERQLQSSKE